MGHSPRVAAAGAKLQSSALMTPEEWHDIKEVLQTALELDPRARANFLDSACAGRDSMRSEVESLLESYEDDEILLEKPPAIDAADFLVGITPAAWIGRRLGPYELLEQTGEGGMGTVYRAVRADGMYDKQVAIKIIRGGLSTDFFVSRFRNERQILAGLEHPNIARLLDGGVTEEGLPYVVLEFVAGVPIDEYCALHDLSIADRLRLFRTVCSAVQHAHRSLVVHRDLKPGNILVTEDRVPKLLDFGIAKIVDPQHEEAGGDRTLTVMRIMTPDFASPEQVRGDPITTSSDVYSLGVILYLLLTGRRPYRVSATAPHEIIKAICDTDPEKPSTVVTRVEKGENPVKADSPVGTMDRTDRSPKREKLRRALSGDLDNIVLKALRKEPERRYASVEQFSEDIRRHLEHLPVIARKDTRGYRASKFVVRHKAGIAATLAVAFTLIGGLLITVREERIAQRRFNDVRNLANSLIFDVHDSIQDLPGSTTARKLIVDRALQYLNALAQESSSDLALQRELATAYERVGLVQGHYLQNSLGDTQGSFSSYQKALRIRQQVEAKSRDWNDRLALARAYRLVANQQWALGAHSLALQNIGIALAASEELKKAHPHDPKVLDELAFDYELAGQILQGTYGDRRGSAEKAEENFRKAIATDEAELALNPDDLDVQYRYADDLRSLAQVLEYNHDDLDAAIECYKKTLRIDLGLQSRSPQARFARAVAVDYSRLGQRYDKLGDLHGSLENFEKGLAVYEQLVHVDPKNVLFQEGLVIAYANTANKLSKVGPSAQALGYVQRSEEIMRALVAADTENKQERGYLAVLLATNGTTLMNFGNFDSALKELIEARSMFMSFPRGSSLDASTSTDALICTEKMAETASRSGQSKLAAEYFQEVLNQIEPELTKPTLNLDAQYLAADSYSGLGDLDVRTARQSGGDREKQKESWIQARAWYRKSLGAWGRIEHPRPVALGDLDVGDPAEVAKKLQLCETALARSTRTLR
jgi:eukaryotic-like serine/threonine-protein kinase